MFREVCFEPTYRFSGFVLKFFPDFCWYIWGLKYCSILTQHSFIRIFYSCTDFDNIRLSFVSLVLKQDVALMISVLLGPSWVLSTPLSKLTETRHCVFGSKSSSLLKSATCLSSDSPTIVKCLLTFDRTRGPFLYWQVFVWVKSLLRSKKVEVLWAICCWISKYIQIIVNFGEISLLHFCSLGNMWTQRFHLMWTPRFPDELVVTMWSNYYQYVAHMPQICV